MTDRREEQEMLGQRIKQAREARGLSQQEVADLLKLSRPTVADIEAGRRRVDSLLLRDLAALFGIPSWELLGSVSESSTSQLNRLREALFAEINSVPVSASDKQKISQFWQALEHFTWLSKEMGRQKPSFANDGERFSSRSPKYVIEAEADRVRGSLGLGDFPIKGNLRYLIESQGIPVFWWPLDPEPFSGLFLNHSELGPVLLVNANQVRWRQMFTLAHEFGHVWLHRNEHVVASRVFASGKDSRTIEAQANTFAAEFLMPAEGIKRASIFLEIDGPLTSENVIGLQRYFRVSYKAILVRLLHLRMISQEQYDELSRESPVRLALRLGYEVDASEVGEIKETLFCQQYPIEYVVLVLIALKKGKIGEGKAAQMLGTDRQTLNDFLSSMEEVMRKQQEEDVPLTVGG